MEKKIKSAVEWVEPGPKKRAKWKAKYKEASKKKTVWEGSIMLDAPFVKLTKSINKQRLNVVVSTKNDKVSLKISSPYRTTRNVVFSLEDWKELNEAVVEARDYLALTGV